MIYLIIGVYRIGNALLVVGFRVGPGERGLRGV